jgi:hypothetical protein
VTQESNNSPPKNPGQTEVSTKAGAAHLTPEVGACEEAACQAGLGVPAAEQRLETLRTALLEMRNLQARYGIPFQAMPELAILGS